MRLVVSAACLVFLLPACFSDPPHSETAAPRRTEPTPSIQPRRSDSAISGSFRRQPRPGEVVYYRLHPDWRKIDKDCGARDRSYVVRHVDVPPGHMAPLTTAVRALFNHWGGRASQIEEVSLSDGRATISLASVNGLGFASTSCGSVGFTGSLLRTVFQFDTVKSLQVHLAGSCKDFGDFMQAVRCQTYTRHHV